jgi:hypothetical protein
MAETAPGKRNEGAEAPGLDAALRLRSNPATGDPLRRCL